MAANLLLDMIKKKYSRINKKEKLSIKSAGKNIKYNIIDAITYNLIESMTKYKNKEIDNNNLNKELSVNLSFVLFNCNKRKKMNKDDDNDYWKQKGKYPIKNFGVYFPINRITFLENEKLINKNKNKKNNNSNKNSSLMNQKLDIFLPSSIIFTEKKSKKNLELSYNSNNNNIVSKKSKNSSFISEESFNSNQNNVNISIESIENNYETNQIKKNRKFDYIECPLIQKKSKKNKINNFVNLLKKFDDLIDSEDINNTKNGNENYDKIDGKLNVNKEHNQEILNTNEKKNFLDPLYANKFLTEELKLNNVNLDNNKKYFKKMNVNYANILHGIFMQLLKYSTINIDPKKPVKLMELKKKIVIGFKQILLSIGISNKNIFEKVFKNYIFSDKLFSFSKFIQSFDTIIYDKDFQNMKLKYLFLLTISTTQDFLGFDKKVCEQFLDNKKIENFFELIGCNYAYIETFSENLGQKLIMRYKAVYKNEEKYNILEGKYSLRKMRITLESFFDQIQKDD